MYQNHSQVGRTRVNKIKEGKKNPPSPKVLYKSDGLTHLRPRSSIPVKTPDCKVVGQFRENKVTYMDKLYGIQNYLLKEGLTMDEYTDYVQDKINNDKYYYKCLSVKDIALLNKRYRRLLQEEDSKYNSLGETKEFNRRQRRLFREKRKVVVDKKKSELIDELYNNLRKSNSLGHLKNTDLHSNDPSRWSESKKTLFVGGRYLEGGDKDWCNVYHKINSQVSANLFDLHSNTELPRYVFEQ